MKNKLKTPWVNETAFYNMHAEKFLSTGKFYHVWMIGKTDEEFAQYIIDKLDLKPTDKVVDLGCGSGFLVSKISKICDCIGISTSEEGIKYAKINFPDCKFEVADMQTFKTKKSPIL